MNSLKEKPTDHDKTHPKYGKLKIITLTPLHLSIGPKCKNSWILDGLFITGFLWLLVVLVGTLCFSNGVVENSFIAYFGIVLSFVIILNYLLATLVDPGVYK